MQNIVYGFNKKLFWRKLVPNTYRFLRHHVSIIIVSLVVCIPVFAGDKEPIPFNLGGMSEEGAYHCIPELTFRGKPVCVYLGSNRQKGTAEVVGSLVSVSSSAADIRPKDPYGCSDNGKNTCNYDFWHSHKYSLHRYFIGGIIGIIISFFIAIYMPRYLDRYFS